MNAPLQTLKKSSHTACILIMCGSAVVLSTSIHTVSAISRVEDTERVKMGEVIAINYESNQITIKAFTTYILGTYDTETLFYLGSGKITGSQNIKLGQIIYLFGIVSKVNTDIKINKVVIRNTSKLLRKTYTLDTNFFSLGNNTSLRKNTSVDQGIIERIKKSIVGG